MRRTCPIRLTDLGDWVSDAVTGWGDLPIYRLAAPNDLPALDLTVESFRTAGLSVVRRRDSGIIEARGRSEDPRTLITPDFLGIVLEASIREDPREYLPDFDDETLRALLPESQFISFRSGVEGGTQVIGPGGKVSIFRTATAVWVDVTVRKKVRAYSSRWRAPRSIYIPCQREFAPWREQIEVEPLAGYFELSKYETQLILRPAFVFIFSVAGDTENAVSWQTIRVEPATVGDEIPLRAGLGQWQSSRQETDNE